MTCCSTFALCVDVMTYYYYLLQLDGLDLEPLNLIFNLQLTLLILYSWTSRWWCHHVFFCTASKLSGRSYHFTQPGWVIFCTRGCKRQGSGQCSAQFSTLYWQLAVRLAFKEKAGEWEVDKQLLEAIEKHIWYATGGASKRNERK